MTDLKNVQASLSTNWVGHTYFYRERVESTNELLKRMLAGLGRANLPSGTVVLADFQSQGKGRLGRRWQAPPQTSLLFSVLFRPDWSAEKANWLTMLAGLAVVEAVAALTTLAPALKWPNDVMVVVNGQWCKVSGLLLEGDVDENGRLQQAIVGIGINVNIPAQQLPAAATPATSLWVATGQPVSRRDLLLAILARIEQHYETAVQGQSPQPAWSQRLINLGQPVQVTNPNSQQVISGLAEQTDEAGRLLVRDEAGQLHTISAGDVTLRV